MKQLRVLDDETEAQMMQGLLRANGIETMIVGSKDYMAHYAGGASGRYVLQVAATDLVPANQILADLNRTQEPAAPPVERNHFARAVVLALLGMTFLPIVLNFYSLRNAFKFWQSSAKDLLAVVKMILIFVLQVPIALIVWFYWRYN